MTLGQFEPSSEGFTTSRDREEILTILVADMTFGQVLHSFFDNLIGSLALESTSLFGFIRELRQLRSTHVVKAVFTRTKASYAELA